MGELGLIGLLLFANATLCFSMRRHQRLVFKELLARRVELALRGLGFALLAVAAWGFVARDGAMVGLAAFVGWFTLCMLVAAGTVTALSTQR
ncbi:MAG: DUF3325 family protein [Pseudomonadota bacterium]